MSMFRTKRHSASITALTNAAGDPTVADSPTPFAPIGWCGDGVTVWAELEARRLPRGREQVVQEVRPDAVPRLVEPNQLHGRRAEPLRETALKLPFHDHRVDPHAAVIHGHHALTFHTPVAQPTPTATA